jgi:F-type H+-transporting ATPase subunit gamma
MEMVSAAKMRRAQERVQASRAYSDRLRFMIGALSNLRDVEPGSFPLLEARPVEHVGTILITPDKGLAGGLNSNIIRRTFTFISREAQAPTQLITVGKKGRDFFARVGQSMTASFTDFGDWPTLDDVRAVVDVAVDDYIEGRTDAVYLVFTQFVNTLTQRPEVVQILPISAVTSEEGDEAAQDFIFEPSKEAVLQALLPRYVEVQVYQAMLEALASEHSARMVAMRSATDNARDLIKELTLTYNKARQTQITGEVTEIAAGAAAQGR